MIKKYATIIIAFILIGSGGFAQETVAATGGDAKGKGGSFSYTVGQVFYTMNTDSKLTVNQGVQQPKKSLDRTRRAITQISLGFTVYPNPSHNTVTLNIGNYKNVVLVCQLYDLLGRVLETKLIIDQYTDVDITHLAASAYILKVSEFESKSLIKTFKIIKN